MFSGLILSTRKFKAHISKMASWVFMIIYGDASHNTKIHIRTDNTYIKKCTKSVTYPFILF